MTNFEDLKNIWGGQQLSPDISYEELLQNIRKTRRSFANKLLKEAIAMVLVILALVAIWFFAEFKLWSSTLSVVILICACLYYVVTQFSYYRKINTSAGTLENSQVYVSYLQRYRQERYEFNTYRYTVFTLLSSISFLLYLVEFYFYNPAWQSLLAFIFCIFWIILCSRMMKIYRQKEQEKLNSLIAQLNRIRDQFSSDEDSGPPL